MIVKNHLKKIPGSSCDVEHQLFRTTPEIFIEIEFSDQRDRKHSLPPPIGGQRKRIYIPMPVIILSLLLV